MADFNRYDEIEKLFEQIYEYAADNSDFNLEYVDSVYNYFEKHGDISDRQFQALERVIEKWSMNG